MDVVCLGELLMDMFPAEVGPGLAEVSAFRPVPGGGPANVAVAVAQLGRESAFLGTVGDDAFGHRLAAALAEKGVKMRGLRFDRQARTTINFMAQPDVHSYECLFYRNPGADTRLRKTELDVRLLAQTKAFHFGSLSLTDEPSRSATWRAIEIARKHGALVSFDVNYRPTLWPSARAAREQVGKVLPRVDCLKVNEMELKLLAGSGNLEAGTKTLLRRGPQAVVVTMGPQGSFLRTQGRVANASGFAVRTVDATGCGDAFVAGLLVCLATDGDWRLSLSAGDLGQMLRYANAVGALTAQKQGVISALPTAAQVEAFLARRRRLVAEHQGGRTE